MVAAEHDAPTSRAHRATCHSDRGKAGGLSLANWDAMKAQQQPGIVEKMIRKLRAGMMPPPGAAAGRGHHRVAHRGARDAHGRVRPSTPTPAGGPSSASTGPSTPPRCVTCSILDVDVTAYLPADTQAHGFDNIADAQAFSPALLEGYLRAAAQVSRLAVGDRTAADSTTYNVPRTASQMRTSRARRSARAAAWS